MHFWQRIIILLHWFRKSKVWCNGRGKISPLRKIPYNIANAKLYKHAQTLTPTKSECDSSDAKPCRDTQTFVLKIIK